MIQTIDFQRLQTNFPKFQEDWHSVDSNNHIDKAKVLNSFLETTNKGQNFFPKIDIANKGTYSQEIINQPGVYDVFYNVIAWLNNSEINSKDRFDIFMKYGKKVDLRLGGGDFIGTMSDHGK